MHRHRVKGKYIGEINKPEVWIDDCVGIVGMSHPRSAARMKDGQCHMSNVALEVDAAVQRQVLTSWQLYHRQVSFQFLE